jgi:long-chain acyl-CoA synthetase
VNTCDYLLARAELDSVAVVESGDRVFTYRQLHDGVSALAGELVGAGLPPGSRVGLLGANSFFWVAAYLAVLKVGHVAVPLSDRSGPEELRSNVDQVGCRAVLVDRRTPAPVLTALAGQVTITDEALAAPPPVRFPSVPVDPGSDAVLMFTSGTTARPRVVRVTHANIQANTESILAYLGLRSDDRILVVLPFYYCFGASLLHTHLRTGARLVLCNSMAFPGKVVDLLADQECTGFAGVPSSYQLLLRASSFRSRTLPALRYLQQAGGKLSTVLVEEVLDAQPDAQLFVMYGQTEATARLSYLPPERLSDKLGSIGRGIPGVELSVLDEEGRSVRAGERGEIYARGANVCAGYLDDPAGTAAKFTPHGLRTGDVAVVDEEGFIYVVDRVADFIKSWGHRISSQELEECALRMPELVSAAAVGVPDPEAGEAITLFVVPAPAAQVQPGDVIAFCRSRLARHKVPSSVVLVEAMPLNANGKIVKARLRELAEGGVVAAAAGR